MIILHCILCIYSTPFECSSNPLRTIYYFSVPWYSAYILHTHILHLGHLCIAIAIPVIAIIIVHMRNLSTHDSRLRIYIGAAESIPLNYWMRFILCGVFAYYSFAKDLAVVFVDGNLRFVHSKNGLHC